MADSEGKIYLTSQPRAGINNLESIEIPAGIVEEGENFKEPAKREMLEETGCIADSIIELGVPFSGDPACCTSITHLFLAINARKFQELHLDSDEYLNVLGPVDMKTALNWIDTGKIRDANSVIALERAAKLMKQLQR